MYALVLVKSIKLTLTVTHQWTSSECKQQTITIWCLTSPEAQALLSDIRGTWCGVDVYWTSMHRYVGSRMELQTRHRQANENQLFTIGLHAHVCLESQRQLLPLTSCHLSDPIRGTCLDCMIEAIVRACFEAFLVTPCGSNSHCRSPMGERWKRGNALSISINKRVREKGGWGKANVLAGSYDQAGTIVVACHRTG